MYMSNVSGLGIKQSLIDVDWVESWVFQHSNKGKTLPGNVIILLFVLTNISPNLITLKFYKDL